MGSLKNIWNHYSGWQKLAAFQREQKWPQNFCQERICYFGDKCVAFAYNCKVTNFIQYNMQYIQCNRALLAQKHCIWPPKKFLGLKASLCLPLLLLLHLHLQCLCCSELLGLYLHLVLVDGHCLSSQIALPLTEHLLLDSYLPTNLRWTPFVEGFKKLSKQLIFLSVPNSGFQLFTQHACKSNCLLFLPLVHWIVDKLFIFLIYGE